MNGLRILGLVLLAVLVVGISVRRPAPPPPTPAAAPVREVFHPAKPLRIEVRSTGDQANPSVVEASTWLERELRYMLTRGQMKIAPLAPAGDAPRAFTLRVTTEPNVGAQLELIAPDGVVERRERLELSQTSRLETMHALAERLPRFLDAPGAVDDWAALIGTRDPGAYESYLRASELLQRPDGVGFTAPPRPGADVTANLERMETLTRRHRAFARAHALLALGYLSIGGDDEPALAKLAQAAAQRALANDAQLAEARAALGIVRARRMEWSVAREHFATALTLDPNSLPALEGLACVLADTGHVSEALPLAQRALHLQPGNRGARACATYAAIATGGKLALGEDNAQTVRIRATMQWLAGDIDAAARSLRAGKAASDELIESLVAASQAPNEIPAALRIITRYADEGSVDAEAELLFGAALQRPDFVLNRMLRMAKQGRAVPTRMLWLPHTEFLRKHPRLREVLAVTDLTAYWQDHGVPDLCADEPKLHLCTLTR